MANEDLAADLASTVGAALGEEVEVEALRRLSGGASRETWAFTTVGATSGRRDLILQRNRPGGPASRTGPDPMVAEDALLAAAEAAGVPVPATVVPVAAAGPLGAARVSAAVTGEALGPRLVRADRTAEGRRALARQMGEALAAIHSIPPEDHPQLERRDILDQARSGLDLLGVARPAFELGLRWLHDHRPPPTPDAVVHGDFRVGNLLVDGDDLTAVLDWEISHRGDPLEDLGWLCVRAWRFGGAHEVGGLADLDDLLDAYTAARGVEVDPAHVRWWAAAGTLSWGLMCAVQAHRHLDGHVRSVELATIGRRVCENEYDLLGLIGVDAGVEPTEVEPVTPPDLHGRPTAVELLDAVRSHLADEIAPLLDGAPAFSLRVVDRALATVQREVENAPADDAAHARRLAALGVADEAELAARIRAGEADAATVGPAVREAVVARLRVANPKWLEGVDRA